MNANEAIGMTDRKLPRPEKPSIAVESLRKEYERDGGNAEDYARAMQEHIKAIDEELDALSHERGRLSEHLLKSVESLSLALEGFRSVATNDYRGNEPTRY